MMAFEVIAGLVTIFITAPIWYFLQYRVLQMVGATDLMWFLFWVYVPVGIFASIVFKLASLARKK